MVQVDFLIIGQGLAGTLFAHTARQAGYRIMVINREQENSSSMVAAGMYTPVNPKRMTTAWMYERLYPAMQEMYLQLQRLTGVSFFHPLPIYNIIASAKESNDFAQKMHDDGFAQYICNQSRISTNLYQPFGGFEIKQSGWMNIPSLILAYRNVLLAEGCYRSQIFEQNELIESDDYVLYKDIKATYAVMCTGKSLYDCMPDLFRSHRGTKGSMLTIGMQMMPDTHILKKGIYVVPLGNGQYKVGSTYKRQFNNDLALDEDEAEICDKLKHLTQQVFNVLSHRAAIRPTTPDRKPVLGLIPCHRRSYIFNGLGTKGVTYGPYFAKHLLEHISSQQSLLPEVDINRFIH